MMSEAPLYGVYGASGHGRESMPMARHEVVTRLGLPFGRLVFVDDDRATREVNGQQVLTYAEFLATGASARHVTVAIGRSEKIRVRVRFMARYAGASPAW